MKTKAKSILFFLTAVGVLATIIIIFTQLGTSSGSPAGFSMKPSIKVSISPYAAMVPIFLAQERNLFEDLSVELSTGGGSQSALEALEAGEADVTLDTLSAKHFNAFRKGVGFRFVAAQAPGPRLLLVRKDLWDSGVIRNVPIDLRGRTVRISGEARSTYYTLAMILKEVGFDIKMDVVTKVIRSSEMIPAFESKSVDVFTGGQEPHRTYAIDKGLAVEYRLNGTDIDGIFLASDRALRERPESVRKFFQGVLRGTELYYRMRDGTPHQREELARIVSEYSEIPIEVVRKMDWPSPPRDGKFDIQKLRDVYEYYLQEGFVEGMVEIERMVDFSYLE